MVVNELGHGQFSVDYWRFNEPVGEPARIEYSDNLPELLENCERYLAARRFAVGVAHRRADATDEWEELDTYYAGDADEY